MQNLTSIGIEGLKADFQMNLTIGHDICAGEREHNETWDRRDEHKGRDEHLSDRVLNDVRVEVAARVERQVDARRDAARACALQRLLGQCAAQQVDADLQAVDLRCVVADRRLRNVHHLRHVAERYVRRVVHLSDAHETLRHHVVAGRRVPRVSTRVQTCVLILLTPLIALPHGDWPADDLSWLVFTCANITS